MLVEFPWLLNDCSWFSCFPQIVSDEGCKIIVLILLDPSQRPAFPSVEGRGVPIDWQGMWWFEKTG